MITVYSCVKKVLFGNAEVAAKMSGIDFWSMSLYGLWKQACTRLQYLTTMCFICGARSTVSTQRFLFLIFHPYLWASSLQSLLMHSIKLSYGVKLKAKINSKTSDHFTKFQLQVNKTSQNFATNKFNKWVAVTISWLHLADKLLLINSRNRIQLGNKCLLGENKKLAHLRFKFPNQTNKKWKKTYHLTKIPTNFWNSNQLWKTT